MALLSQLNTVAKGSSATILLDKSELVALGSVAADSYWSDLTNVSYVKVVYKSSTGHQKATVVFNDITQSSPSGVMKLSSKARNGFVIHKIVLCDFDGGYLEVPVGEIPTGLDIDLSGGGNGG